MAEVIWNGEVFRVEDGTDLRTFLKEKGIPGLVARIDGELRDIPEKAEGVIEVLDFSSPEGKETFWHTSAHVLAYAVTSLFPEAKPGMGPPLEEGFFYDFGGIKVSAEDFPRIEEKMKEIIEKDIPVKRRVVSYEEAKRIFKDNPYKLELIEEAYKKGEILSVYEMGEFVDFCRGPHIPSTGMIGAIKITKLGAAHWKGDPENEQLTRIYGISFPTKEEMKKWEELQEEIRKRDHRRIGEELDLYSFQELAPGMPVFHWKGWRIYRALENFIREKIEARGYLEVRTPILWNTRLWRISGHWDHYKENMYFVKIDNELFGLKPMNCPAHCMIYKSRARSYKDLPLRIAEFGHVHRHELSGVLSGLFRVRAFTQDDAHIFAREDQIEQEIAGLLELVKEVYGAFGFEFRCMLSTRPEDYMGDLDTWNRAEEALMNALQKSGFEFQINEGDGAFYGPKIDIQAKDSIGRWWQLATIQLDFQMPVRFDLRYMGEDGTNNHRPVMIHRAIYGSIERFLGILVENFAGKFPLWLSPEQVRVIPVSEKHREYARKVYEELRKRKFWAEIDERDMTVGKKIREAQLSKVNYAVVVGDKEVESGTVSVRARDGLFNVTLPLEKMLENLEDERKRRLLRPDTEKWTS